MRRGVGISRGKVILFGEHAVVHGHPALAAGIDRGVVVEVIEDSGGPVMEVDPWDLEARPTGKRIVDTALAHFLEARDLLRAPLRLRATSDIPLGAGLGSSAALFVAAAAALSSHMGLPDDRPAIEEWATVAERVFHGSPSGVDVAATARGGIGWFVRGKGWEPIALADPMTLAIAREPGRRNTTAIVSRVRDRLEKDPKGIASLFARIAETTCAARGAIEIADFGKAGELMSRNHALLAELGVSTSGLDRLCEVALAAGALGAKMTGAGGGGSVIALAPGRERRVVAALREIGREAFSCEIGA
ncbi:MAG: mevalonate kinase [Gemmatimonadetes bacterium]|nr:mevalonate kinase [Gemmatimonadota bacterium]